MNIYADHVSKTYLLDGKAVSGADLISVLDKVFPEHRKLRRISIDNGVVSYFEKNKNSPDIAVPEKIEISISSQNLPSADDLSPQTAQAASDIPVTGYEAWPFLTAEQRKAAEKIGFTFWGDPVGDEFLSAKLQFIDLNLLRLLQEDRSYFTTTKESETSE